MQIVETIGNRSLMDREKSLFICSKRTPIGLYDDVFRWTDSLTEQDCIACFNSTEMESEVLKALLVAKVPTILFVMNRFTDVHNMQIEHALRDNRMLIVVLRRDEPQKKGQTPRLRNQFVLNQCQHVYCGYVNKNGTVFGLLAGRKDVTYLIEEQSSAKVANNMGHLERWTVAEDKMLLRLFYADMGIHAIHKRLNRSYAAVNARLRSITQPEELLKGREFEDYVLSLFSIQAGGVLVLQEWQGDKSYGEIHPENNSLPDFIFRYGKMEFAIECKWRERLRWDFRMDLFPPKRMETFKRFSEVRGIPVSFIIGVGGEPCNPDLLYVIPMSKVDTVISGVQPIGAFQHPLHAIDVLFLLSREEHSQEKLS